MHFNLVWSNTRTDHPIYWLSTELKVLFIAYLVVSYIFKQSFSNADHRYINLLVRITTHLTLATIEYFCQCWRWYKIIHLKNDIICDTKFTKKLFSEDGSLLLSGKYNQTNYVTNFAQILSSFSVSLKETST